MERMVYVKCLGKEVYLIQNKDGTKELVMSVKNVLELIKELGDEE